MQQCSSCGKQTPLGEDMLHFAGCQVWSKDGEGQGQAHRDFLAGFGRAVKSGRWNTESTPPPSNAPKTSR